MNVLFEYLYRDAGNNKKWGEVVFSNQENTNLNILNSRLRNSLIDHEFFVAEESLLPKIGFDDKTELDHDWYEFHAISSTSNTPNDIFLRDISDFISGLEKLETPQTE